MKNKSSKSKIGATKRSTTNGKKLVNESEDVATLILRDHRPIKELILVLKDPDIGIIKKQRAYKDFEKSLSTHAKAEQESLYIHLKEVDDLRMEGLEGDTEHAIADQLMEEIRGSTDDDDKWLAKVKVLAELVDHHVKEEEKDVLKAVRKEFDLNERIEIGATYSRLLNKYRQEMQRPKEYPDQSNLRVDYV